MSMALPLTLLVFGRRKQVTQDQFDAMDFSDNEIKKLDNFPRYKRLSSLLLCNNHVSRIALDLGAQLPSLSCLILTNNKVTKPDIVTPPFGELFGDEKTRLFCLETRGWGTVIAPLELRVLRESAFVLPGNPGLRDRNHACMATILASFDLGVLSAFSLRPTASLRTAIKEERVGDGGVGGLVYSVSTVCMEAF